jgi:site-specific recombinase XerD
MSTDLAVLTANLGIAERTLTTQTPWREAVAAFLSARDSQHTQRAYARHLAAAFAGFGVNSVGELSSLHLAAYRHHITSSDLSPASQGQALAALRAFLRWARAVGVSALPGDVTGEMLRTPRTSVRKPYSVLSEHEVAAIGEVARSTRDRALLAVMLGAGLRAGEVVALDVSDVHEDQDGEITLYVRLGKGRKDRSVPVLAPVAALLRRYLAETGRRLGGDGPLFLSGDRAGKGSGRLSARGVGYLVAGLASAAGIDAKRVSPHALRHTYALRALRSGSNVVAVGKLLGHASIQTTQRYLDHLETAELRRSVPPLPAWAS